jgi:hypothetical protein
MGKEFGDFDMPRKSKKQGQAGATPQKEPELGQKEAHLQRKSDSELSDMQGGKSEDLNRRDE